MKNEFLLDPEIVFPNHGSFGACLTDTFAQMRGYRVEHPDPPALKRWLYEEHSIEVPISPPWLRRSPLDSRPERCDNVGVANRYTSAANFRAELRRFLRRSEDLAREQGLTPQQHALLLQIAGAEDETTTVSELVATLALTQSAVTELVQRAETAGLVQRTQSAEDGRVVHLSVTRLGEKKLAAVHDALGPERAQFRAVLERM